MQVEHSSSPGTIGNGASMDQDMRYAVKRLAGIVVDWGFCPLDFAEAEKGE